MGRRINVAEDRTQIRPLESLCGRDESKCRRDNLALQTEGFGHHYESDRCIGDANSVPDAEERLQTSFEFLRQRTMVGIILASENIAERRLVLFPGGKIQLADG